MTWTHQQMVLQKFTTEKKMFYPFYKTHQINSISIKDITVNIKTAKRWYLDGAELSSLKIIAPSTKTKQTNKKILQLIKRQHKNIAGKTKWEK